MYTSCDVLLPDSWYFLQLSSRLGGVAFDPSKGELTKVGRFEINIVLGQVPCHLIFTDNTVFLPPDWILTRYKDI